jgi:murein DD-endopeptidase MepM/ murein hydrolase activator NlpD
MARVKTNFIQSSHGFQFPNRFEVRLPTKFQFPFSGSVDLNQVVFGLCGGMCFTALDYFKLNELPPMYFDVKEIDQKLFVYLCERQLESLKIPTLFKVFEWMLSEDQTIATKMSRYEIPKLRRLLDKGEPAVLALIRVRGLDDPTQNHQVLATGYEYDPVSKDYTINLYDPNHPHKEPTLKLNLSEPKSGPKISQSTGEHLRGFFIIPYKQRKTAPRPVQTIETTPFGLYTPEPAFKLHWPVDSRRVNQYFGENPATYKPFGLPGHEGVDLFALSGANVYAAAGGEVHQVGHPKGHPYGLQIRIKHSAHGKQYQTVYAHLSQALVNQGQMVSAGQLIGLADNTGNSFGSHLHLTLKIDGEQTPGYPKGIVDPWPYLKESASEHDSQLPAPSGLTVYTTSILNLREKPGLDTKILALLPSGEALSVLGEAGSLRQKIGVQGEWLQVITSAGQSGYVAAWMVQDLEQAFPPSDLVVYPFASVNLRSGPGTAFNLLATLTTNDPLTVLGDASIAQAKLCQTGEWLQVQTDQGIRGFVAAWLVHRTGQTAPASDLVVYPISTLNMRARPSTDANILTVVTQTDPLTVLGDKYYAKSLIGQEDQWLNIQTPDMYCGYVAAWLVQAAGRLAPELQPGTIELLVFPREDLNMRAQPTINSPRVDGAYRDEPLRVIEPDLDVAKGKIGQAGQWIYAQKKDGQRGWLAAWLLRL